MKALRAIGKPAVVFLLKMCLTSKRRDFIVKTVTPTRTSKTCARTRDDAFLYRGIYEYHTPYSFWFAILG